MVGMLQIIPYLLCVYLIYKGVEILQVALMSNRTNRTAGIIIGIGAIIISLIAAGFFKNKSGRTQVSRGCHDKLE
jgi:uncharacterized membrane protein (DUF485 family)